MLVLVVYLFIPNREYQILICIQSLTIVFTTLGVDWINVLFEDFLYITIRSIIIQILSLILMFVLVKTANDLYLYTFISVIGSGISCILNLIYCRKYLKLSLVLKLDLVKHFKPIMVLFSGGLVISIYANSDMLILEWFKGAYYVGLYAVSARVYTILKNFPTRRSSDLWLPSIPLQYLDCHICLVNRKLTNLKKVIPKYFQL